MEVQGCANLLNDNGLLNELMHWQESTDALKKEIIIIIKVKMENILRMEAAVAPQGLKRFLYPRFINGCRA